MTAEAAKQFEVSEQTLHLMRNQYGGNRHRCEAAEGPREGDRRRTLSTAPTSATRTHLGSAARTRIRTGLSVTIAPKVRRLTRLPCVK